MSSSDRFCLSAMSFRCGVCGGVSSQAIPLEEQNS